MRLFVLWVELANVVAVQRLHDADAREHCRAAVRRLRQRAAAIPSRLHYPEHLGLRQRPSFIRSFTNTPHVNMSLGLFSPEAGLKLLLLSVIPGLANYLPLI